MFLNFSFNSILLPSKKVNFLYAFTLLRCKVRLDLIKALLRISGLYKDFIKKGPVSIPGYPEHLLFSRIAIPSERPCCDSLF